MRMVVWFIVGVVVLVCVARSRADDIKVTHSGDAKVRVSVDPPAKSLIERFGAWRAARRQPIVVAVPATVAIPAEMPRTRSELGRPAVITIERK